MAKVSEVDFDPFSETPIDTALRQEGVKGKLADIARSVYQQESGSGKNTKTSNQNAVGGMQIKPGTFDEVADKGWDIKNPIQNARAGVRYLKDRYEQAKGDPKLTAAGYYGGPGGLEKAKKGVAVSDPKNPNAPTTLQYGEQVASRVPKATMATVKEVDFDPFAQAQTPTPTPEKKPDITSKDKDYKRGDVSKATFGEAARDVGQTALSLGSGLVGGMAGLAAEAATAATPLLHDPKPYGLGLDPYKVKEKVSNALQYEPKTEGARKMAEIASIPGRIMGAPLEKALEVTPDPLKPAVDIAGNVLMAQAPRMAGAATRKLMVGNEEQRARMRGNVAAFKRAEVPQYTLGQVSEGGFTGGAGAPKSLIREQENQLANRASKVADQMSATKSPEEAGKIIREAIGGTPETKDITLRKGARPQTFETGKKIGGYLDNARSMESSLYDDMYKKVGRDTKWGYPRLFKALDDMTQQNPNLMSTSGGFINKGILDLRERLIDDTTKAPKQLGYEDARWLRSKIGELTDPRQIVPGDTSKVAITPAQADALYAAISEDMMAGVAGKGPRAEAAVLKANQFSRQLHHDINTHLQPIMNSRLTKDVYDNALSGTREGSERVAATMKTLDKFQKDSVRSVFFRELGREGENWDMNKFMSEYRKMHPAAKEELFGAGGKSKYRNDLDTIAKVGEKLSVDENTWHKLKSFMLTEGKLGTAAAAGAVAGLASHSVLPVFLAGPAAGFITGNLVRNPKFIDWFAKSSMATRGSAIPVMLANLQRRTADMSPEDRQEVEDYINKVQSNMTENPNENPAR